MTEKAKTDKAAPTPTWSLLESAIWSPAKAGDNIIGNLEAPEPGPFGEQHPLKDATLANAAHTDCGPAAARVVLPHLAALKDLSRVPIGAMVRVTYTGDKVSKAGHTYKAFTIETAI